MLRVCSRTTKEFKKVTKLQVDIEDNYKELYSRKLA